MLKNDRLYHLMENLNQHELLFVLKNGLGIKENIYNSYPNEKLKDIISIELRSAASNNFANFFRLQHEFPYKQIIIDVAKTLSNGISDRKKARIPDYSLNDNHTEEEIEKAILKLFEIKTQEWWKGLNKKEREDIADKIADVIDPEVVNTVNRWTLIKYRITKEVKDSIFTKGVIIAMLTLSAGGIVGAYGGSMLTRIGWNVVVPTLGYSQGLRMLMSGKWLLDIIGAVTAGMAVFVPSTIYYYADVNYRKTIPTIVMLLSKYHMNKGFR
ncbi:MAG: hypothetical protein HQK77_02440 [Desulfobacterales bacterium]|nr:hypothetical protein [Desulfobacterales bacterium]